MKLKKTIIGIAIAGAAVGGFSACGLDNPPPTKPKSSVAQGGASKSAVKDVKLGEMTTPYDTIEIPVTVTNHSEKASDYNIEATVYDDSGTQVATAFTYIDRVAPSGKARDKLIAPEGGQHAVKYKLTLVERTASMGE